MRKIPLSIVLSQARATLLVATALCCAPHNALAGDYNYGYGVNSPYTGDVKDVQESKNGDQVSGHYRLLEPDGRLRTVNYQANPLTGFQAQVTQGDSPVENHGFGQAADREQRTPSPMDGHRQPELTAPYQAMSNVPGTRAYQYTNNDGSSGYYNQIVV